LKKGREGEKKGGKLVRKKRQNCLFYMCFNIPAPASDPLGKALQDRQNDVLPAITQFSSCQCITTYCTPNNNRERTDNNHSPRALSLASLRKNCRNNLEVPINSVF
jgi:hypothetical protein